MIVGRRIALLALSALTAPLMLLVGACSSSTVSGSPLPSPGEETSVGADGGETTSDAGTDTGNPSPPGTCEGACKTTSLMADFGGKKRTLVRAQFGTQPGDGGVDLHTESHLGGAAACPSETSPSPDYTLLVTPIPRGAAGRKLSDRDKVTSNFFDFKGDLGLAAPSGITKAITVNLTVTAEDPSTPPKWVAIDVSAAFREGEITGHLYAELCDSLSE
jgi:hypothetical protein